MKNTQHIATIILSLAALAAAAAAEAPPPARGTAVAICVEQAPPFNGAVTDAVWRLCAPWPLGNCTSDEPMKYKTTARVLFSPTHLFVGVECDEPDTDGLVANAFERDGDVWQDDSVEIFVRADPEKPYRQFTVNPNGVLFDASEEDKAWNSSADVRTVVSKDKAWSVTVRIPLTELDAYVGENETWTMNINRTRPARGNDPLLEYSWSIMSSTRYQSPQEFGTVEGVRIQKRNDGVTRLRERPPPKPVALVKGEERGGVTVYCRVNFDKDAGDWTGAEGGEVTLTDDAVDGKALLVRCSRQWAGATAPLNISGSADLKMAYHMKARKLDCVGLNVADKVSDDNTTPYGARYLPEAVWVPVLYHLSDFRYNSKALGTVGRITTYESVRFFGSAEPVQDASFILDDYVIYRGTDKQPPAPVAGLKASAIPEGVRLTWVAAEDNVGAMLYVISRANGDGPFVKVGESVATQWLDTADLKGAFRYRVFAVDFEENRGAWSAIASVQAEAAPAARELSVEEKDRLLYAQHVREVWLRGAGKVRRNHAVMYGDSLTGATLYPQTALAAFRTLTVDAFGHPAMTSRFGRDVAPRTVQENNPEFLCVLYGTNNGKALKNISDAMDDLAAIVKTGEDNGTVVLLGTIPPRGFGDPDSKPEAEYNKSVIELGRKLQVPVAYIFEAIQAGGDRKLYISSDGTHWTGEGMELAGKAWGRAMEQARFSVRDQQ